MYMYTTIQKSGIDNTLNWSKVTFYSSKNSVKCIRFHKIIKQHIIDNKKCFFSAPNQHIIMISQGSGDTEDWSNDAQNAALPSQE